MSEYICKVCSNQNKHKVFQAKEMMFGTEEVFDYFECGRCGSLQIVEIPQDQSKYYPDNYCSSFYQNNKKVKPSFWKGLIRKAKILIKKQPEFFQWLKKTKANQNSKILDVGCGSGELLFLLNNCGFKKLLGIDPYIDQTKINQNGIKIIKAEISEIKEKFDLIILHHSFEHMIEPQETLAELKKILTPKGEILIRMPIVNYAWKKYGPDWVQLDAPRHLFVPTLKGLKLLINNCGLKLVSITFDSTEFQFLASEQYQKGISLFDPKSFTRDKTAFSFWKILKFKSRATVLNKKNLGDSAFLVLKK